MALSLILVKKIAVFFIIMTCGFLIVRLGLVKSEQSRLLSVLNAYVLMPGAVLQAFSVQCTAERIHDLIVLTITAAGVHLLFIGLARLFKKPLRLTNTEQAALIYTNAGSLVIPLAAALFGSEMTYFAIAFASTQVLFIWTHGKMLISGEQRFSARKVFLNFNVIVVYLGIILFLTGIRLPSLALEACVVLNDMMGPICMLTIGMLIGGVDLKATFLNGRTYLITFLRLIVFPILMILCFKITNLTYYTTTRELAMIVTLAGAAPVAANVVNIAQLYGGDESAAVRVNIVTTVLCILTMPLMLQVYKWMLLR